jgi:hypothetical protein
MPGLQDHGRARQDRHSESLSRRREGPAVSARSNKKFRGDEPMNELIEALLFSFALLVAVAAVGYAFNPR